MAERASKTFWQLLLFFSPMLFGDFLRIAVDLKAAWALDLVCRYEEAIGLGNIFILIWFFACGKRKYIFHYIIGILLSIK